MNQLVADVPVCCQVKEAVLQCANAAFLDSLVQRLLVCLGSLLKDEARYALPPIKPALDVCLLMTKNGAALPDESLPNS